MINFSEYGFKYPDFLLMNYVGELVDRKVVSSFIAQAQIYFFDVHRRQIVDEEIDKLSGLRSQREESKAK